MTNQNVLCRCPGAALNWQGELYKTNENGWSGIQETEYSLIKELMLTMEGGDLRVR
jgi:hypothetical protein